MSKVDNGLKLRLGEVVTIVGPFKEESSYARYNIKTDEGETGTVRVDGMITTKGRELIKYTLNDRRAYYMSKEKFERLYIGKSFEQVESLYSKALVITNKGDKKEGVYELRILDKTDGRFYNPTIIFENNIAKSYSLEKDLNFKKTWYLNNNIFLKYLPLSDKILDVDFFANLIKGNTFETPVLADFSNSNFKKVLAIVISIFIGIGGLLWIFATNLIIPLLLFGLLKLRYPLIFVSNKIFPLLFLVVAIISTYIWLVLGLSYCFLWWFFIPILIYSLLYANREVMDFFSYSPPQRCDECKRLYSIVHQKKELIGEKKEWRKMDSRGALMNSSTKWKKTWDKVTTTTTYGDGSSRSSSHDENVKYHSTTTRTYRHNLYNVLYNVLDYKHTHVCRGCGKIYYTYSQELVELDSKLIDSYLKDHITEG